MLKIEGLKVRYGKQQEPVLSGVHLLVGAGECVAMVGPSGSGKTTLLKAINATVPVESGRVEVDGVEVTQARGPALRAIRSRIAVVSQRHDLVDRLAAYQNVMAGALGRWTTLRALRFLLWPTRQEMDEALEALDAVGIGEKLRAPTSQISGGQQQRVAIARALVQHPLVILADEPVAALDPKAAAQVLELLSGLARERGIALLCSLHQPELADRYFDRIVLIEAGTAREVSVPPLVSPAREALAL